MTTPLDIDALENELELVANTGDQSCEINVDGVRALISAARERDALRAALAECVADFEEASHYKGYLAEKHGDREAIERYRLLLKDPK